MTADRYPTADDLQAALADTLNATATRLHLRQRGTGTGWGHGVAEVLMPIVTQACLEAYERGGRDVRRTLVEAHRNGYHKGLDAAADRLELWASTLRAIEWGEQ